MHVTPGTSMNLWSNMLFYLPSDVSLILSTSAVLSSTDSRSTVGLESPPSWSPTPWRSTSCRWAPVTDHNESHGPAAPAQHENKTQKSFIPQPNMYIYRTLMHLAGYFIQSDYSRFSPSLLYSSVFCLWSSMSSSTSLHLSSLLSASSYSISTVRVFTSNSGTGCWPNTFLSHWVTWNNMQMHSKCMQMRFNNQHLLQ